MNKFLLGALILCLAIPLFLFGPASFKEWKSEWQVQQQLEKSRKTNNALTQLMRLQAATHQYAQDHQGRMPPMQNAAAVKKALQPYLNAADFVSIASGQEFQPNPSVSGKPLNKSGNVIWFYDAKRPSETDTPSDSSRAVTYSAGTMSISEAIWQIAKKKSGIP